MYVNISSKINNGILGRNLNSDGINTFTNMDGVKVFSQNSGEEEQFFIIDEDRDDDQNPEEAEGIYTEPEIDPGKVQSINQPFVAEKPSRESYKDDILLYRPIKVKNVKSGIFMLFQYSPFFLLSKSSALAYVI